jgi:thiamine-monophosphate kinase
MQEAELLREIQAIFARPAKPNLSVPNGDDGAVFRSNKEVIACADVAVEGVHFKPEWSSFFEVGRKITAANLADICAMGGWPEFVLVTVVLPEKYVGSAIELAKGIAFEADLVGAQVIGGDISSGRELSISITALGETSTPLLRSGARVGDSVYVSDLPGLSAAGLELLNLGKVARLKIEERAISQHKAPAIEYFKYRESYLKLNSAIDISDGLASDAGHIANASGVRIDLDVAALKLSELKEIDGERFLDWVLNGGEDHVLLGTSSEVVAGFIKIGKVLTGQGVTLDGKEITAGGFAHNWKKKS